MPSSVRLNQKIIMAGGLHLKVVEILEAHIKCKVIKSGPIGSGKRVFLRGSSMKNMPVVTQKDVQDIMFALGEGVEFLAVSHVKSPDDITSIRKIIQIQGNLKIFFSCHRKFSSTRKKQIIAPFERK